MAKAEDFLGTPAPSAEEFLSEKKPDKGRSFFSGLSEPSEYFRQLGLTGRALGPMAAGAGVGAMLGAPAGGIGAIPGAALGAGIMGIGMPLADLAYKGYNAVTGSHVATPSEAWERGMSGLPGYVGSYFGHPELPGLPEPKSSAERVMQHVVRGVAGAGTGAGAAAAVEPVMQAAGRPVAAGVAGALSQWPVTQMASGATGPAVQGTMQEAGAPAWASVPAGIAASVLPSVARPGVLREMLPTGTERTAPTGTWRDWMPHTAPETEQTLENANIRMSPGMRFQGTHRLAEEVMRWMPTSAPQINRLQEQAWGDLTETLMNGVAGRGLARDPNVPGQRAVTPAVADRTRQGFRNEYEDLISQMPTINSRDPRAWNELRNIRNDYSAGRINAEERVFTRFSSRLEDIFNPQRWRPGINGRQYQDLMSDLRDATTAAFKRGDGDTGNALNRLQDAVNNALERNAGSRDLQEQWRALNDRYRQFSIVEDALHSSSVPSGYVSPTAFANAVKNRVGTSAWVEGRTPLIQLARAAKEHISNPVPNSGTAQRSLYQDLLMPKPGQWLHGGMAGAELAGHSLLTPALDYTGVLATPAVAGFQWSRPTTPASLVHTMAARNALGILDQPTRREEEAR